MKKLLVLTICAPVFLQAQLTNVLAQHVDTPTTAHHVTGERPGIEWVENLNWKQVLKKAKKENKFIFADCFTTRCGPCKKMDSAVYANDSVGSFLNAHFISVKVQMDSTNTDNEYTRSWYKKAREMRTAYQPSAYPTFLFFSPNGEIVYKDFDYKEPDQFMQVARDALNPAKQYYALIKAYTNGKKDSANMPYLITTAKQLGDTANYQPLLMDYYDHLLHVANLYSKENIAFIASTLATSTHPLFAMFYPDPKPVDLMMKKEGYSRQVVDRIIMLEKVDPFLQAATGTPEPDWDKLYFQIVLDYQGDYADRMVLEAKLKWYEIYGNILKYAAALNDKMEKYGSDTTNKVEDFKLNNQAFIIWFNINDEPELRRTTHWMEGVVRRGEKATATYSQYWPNYIDTYANLLYKVGETRAALNWQELAVTKGRELAIAIEYIKAIEENLEKMKKGEPTWPIEMK